MPTPQPQQCYNEKERFSSNTTPTKQLDESDATSMTTTSSSATPSPRNSSSDICLSSADSSPSCSTLRQGRNSNNNNEEDGDAGRNLQQHQDHQVAATYSMLSALTTSPHDVDADDALQLNSSDSGSNAWSDSDNDCLEHCHDFLPEDDNHSSNHQIPLKGQTLFLDSDDDDHDNDEEDDDDCIHPSERHNSSYSTTTDSPTEPTTRSSWASSSSLHQRPPSRTRRSSSRAIRTTSDTNTSSSKAISTTTTTPPSGFSIPEHRRRNSTGKCHTSPHPHTGGRHVNNTPLRTITHNCDNNNIPPPNSNSKVRKKHKKALELPGLASLEDRLSFRGKQSGSTASSSSLFESSSSSSPALPSTRTAIGLWLCRIRLTTLVWGLVMIGFTILGKTAMIASQSALQMHSSSSKLPSPPQPPPTGGLRGSLLLATVGHHNPKKSHSKDHHQHHDQHHDAAVKHSATTKEEKKTKKPPAEQKKTADTTTKHHHPKKDDVTTSSTANKHAPLPSKPRSVVYPKPLGVRRTFEDQDPEMYASPPPSSPSSLLSSLSSSLSSSSVSTTPKRTVMLHQDIIVQTPAASSASSSYQVEQYPADFTDNTQFYGQFDSSDARLQTMELRPPYEDGECVPMQEWQTTYHPSCNGVHELGVEYLGEDPQTSESNFSLFGTKGYWRYAWRLDLRRQLQLHANNNKKYNEKEETFGDTVVLKTLKFQHNFEDAHFEHDRIDAVAMERLTSSPHVINIFGFCGHSVLTEYAHGPRLGELADKSRHKPLARLKIARDIANGLADVHGIDAPDGSNATFVHLDINPANVISIDGTLKLNDFNIGIIRKWNTTAQEPCGFPAQYPNPQWRSPEEARGEKNLTEKVDVFSMGHIYFRLICGREPWNKLEPGGKPSKEDINEKVQKGVLPFIPESIMNTTDKEVAAIRDTMLECYRTDPKDRPTAREIASKLERALEALAAQG